MSGKQIQDIRIGDFAVKTDRVVYANASLYASITGDNNPIHFETKEAYQSRFGKPIAHGMIAAGFVSGVIGMLLPGEGCIYEKQSMAFIRPVFYGDVILTRVTVMAINLGRNRITLKTDCFNQNGKLVLTGEATVLPKE